MMGASRRAVVITMASSIVVGGVALLASEDPAPALVNPAAESFTPSAEFQEWITAVVREQLPENYEKRKNWGHTARSFDGISIKMEDGRLKTHRKYKEANDGT